jgi:hypothetical protein
MVRPSGETTGLPTFFSEIHFSNETEAPFCAVACMAKMHESKNMIGLISLDLFLKVQTSAVVINRNLK